MLGDSDVSEPGCPQLCSGQSGAELAIPTGCLICNCILILSMVKEPDA